jgi:hypothetical protein
MATGKARIFFSGLQKIKLFKTTITDFHRYNNNILNYFQFSMLEFCIYPFSLVYVP